ncbi:MAG: DEAD/DEAH box helicase [Bacteroidota bacterium]
MKHQHEASQLILLLRRHRALGYVFSPFWGKQDASGETAYTESSLTSGDSSKISLSAKEKKIIELSAAYSDSALVKKFVNYKKAQKVSTKNFFDEISSQHFEKVVQPFVHRRLNDVFELALQTQTPVYLKEGTDTAEALSQKIELNEAPLIPEFFFKKTQGGEIVYRLNLSSGKEIFPIKSQNIRIISNDPVLILKNRRIYKVDGVTSKNLQPFFTRDEVVIPARFTQKYLSGFVRKAIRDYDVHLEGMQLEEKEIAHPESILKVCSDLYGKPSLELEFQYDGQSVRHHQENISLVTLQDSADDIRFIKLKRNPDQEKKVINKLKNVGLKHYQESYFRPEFADTFASLVQWINRHQQWFSENGFVVKEQENNITHYLGQIQLSVTTEQSKPDWFDLYMEVRLEDVSFPFVMLRQHIRNGNPVFELEDGRIFVIPETWFTDYAELFRFGKKQGARLALQKHHMGLIPSGDNADGRDSSIEYEAWKELYEVSFTENVAEPEGLEGQLREYQKTGLTWLYMLHQHGFGGCLADDMGLGKTIQTIALLLKTKIPHQISESPSSSQMSLFSEPPEERPAKPSLLVMPTSLLYNWKQEVAKFAPSLRVLSYTGSDRPKPEVFSKYDLILTSYGVMRIDKDILSKHAFHYLILDESQFVKNPRSKTYQALLELESDYRLALTGTPVENSLSDLWAQLNFLNRNMLGDHDSFMEEFVNPIERDHDEKMEERLKRLIKPFILRRKKEEVVKELPDLTEQIYWCEMTEKQEDTYERYKSGIRNSLMNVFDSGYLKNKFLILEALMRLRQMSNHPALADNEYDGDSGKFNEAVRAMHNLISEGHKVLVFSSFTGYLDMFANYLQQQKIQYAMLTGQSREREMEVKKFQNDENIHLFLISLKAGGTGLNLTAADYVFILDPWWNPAAENQALSRAHRIGQKNKVFVYRFITRNTIEEKIYALQQKKQKVADTFVNSNNPFKQLSDEEIKSLF